MMKKKQTEEKEMKGAEIAIRCLEKANVETIFAYPGGQSIELHQALKDAKIRVVLPRHEQGGAFAAVGYARITGKTGVCMATSGPGATNLITGIADAYMDSVPLVVVTGQVGTHFIGKNAFQETDIIGITRPIVKHSYLVMDINDIPKIFAEAFYLANSGRPGPVVIDIPKNIQQQRSVPVFPEEVILRAYRPEHKLNEADVLKIKDAIKDCKRPCIYAGGGIITAEASDALRKFAESFNIPVVTTLMGIGCIPDKHPLCLKWLGMHGTVYANNAANEADLLLAFGARFDDRVTGPVKTFAQDAKIVHVDIDLSEINKNKHADIGVLADIKDMLDALNKAPIYKEYKEWHAQIREWKKKYPLSYKENNNIQPQYVIQTLSRLTKGEAVIVPGVGQHQMWSGQYYEYKYPRQFLTSGGLGSMGFGLPAAMGAKIACPDKLVVNIDGDGSFQMNIQELGTIHNEDVWLKMIILNNQHLGMVAQWEDRFYGSRRGNTDLRNARSNRPYPDFVTIAKGYQIPGREVYKKSEVEDAIREMLETPGPFLIDCHTGYQEHVLPMIPPGKTYKDILNE
ncbi:MAG: acetolactate synthase, large subunit, biosynthetic type [Lentisphaerae bacterium GWF2_44_16]|nr:MAG: acetolactate synthase, large subunit, biosynthetic type [Lentisphaerae bacterium GWF2_44_16]